MRRILSGLAVAAAVAACGSPPRAAPPAFHEPLPARLRARTLRYEQCYKRPYRPKLGCQVGPDAYRKR